MIIDGKTYTQRRYERKVNGLKKQDYTKRLKYKKLVATIVKTIVKNDNAYLTNNDIKIISKKVYGKESSILSRVIKRMMEQDIVKKDINNELQRILTDAGFNKDKLKDLYKQAEEFAKVKKDGNLLLKIADKIERANNLVNDSRVNVSQTQIIDYSKVDEAGNPAVKDIKKIETVVSNNGSSEDLNNNVANSSEKEDSDNT